ARGAAESEMARLHAVLEQAEASGRRSNERDDEMHTSVAKAEARARHAEEQAASLEARVGQAEALVEDLRAESESWQAQLADLRARGGGEEPPESDAAHESEEVESLRSEVSRLTGELARTIELRQAAEQRFATLTAELIARDKADTERRSRDESNVGTGSHNGNGA